LTQKLISMLFGDGASMLAVTEALGRHKRLLPPQCSERSQSEINPVN